MARLAPQRERDFRPLLLLPAAMGAALILFGTVRGPGISADSTVYLSAAENFAAGRGVIAGGVSGGAYRVTQYPPLFPVLIGGLGALGPGPGQAARWLNAVVFGVNIFLVGLLLRRICASTSWPLLGSFLFLASAHMLHIHSYAWSEPSFLLLTMAGLLSLDTYLHNHKSTWLLLSSLYVAATSMDRYAGVALALTGMICLLLLTNQPYRVRIRRAALFGVVAAGPMFLWVLRNYSLAGNAGRSGQFSALHGRDVHQALHTLSSWLLPGIVPYAVRTAVLLTGVGILASMAIVVVLRRSKRPEKTSSCAGSSKVRSVSLIFAALYLMVLLVARIFFDPMLQADFRILSPLFIVALVLVLWLIEEFLRATQGKRILPVLSVLLILLFSAASAARASVFVVKAHRDGLGYSDRQWQESEIVAEARKLPPSTPLYSNAPLVLHFLTGRPAIGFPFKDAGGDEGMTEEYKALLMEVGERMQAQGAVLVYLDRMAPIWYMPTEEEMAALMSLVLVKRKADGAIYRVVGSDNPPAIPGEGNAP